MCQGRAPGWESGSLKGLPAQRGDRAVQNHNPGLQMGKGICRTRGEHPRVRGSRATRVCNVASQRDSEPPCAGRVRGWCGSATLLVRTKQTLEVAALGEACSLRPGRCSKEWLHPCSGHSDPGQEESAPLRPPSAKCRVALGLGSSRSAVPIQGMAQRVLSEA